MRHDLFISYSAQDRVTAESICEGLERSGIRCWMAPRDIVAGVSWAEAIIEAIAASKVMLLIFSSNSNASRQVLREIEYAISEDVAIVPFRIEDVPPSKAMRYFIGVPHWFDGVSPPIERHLEELTRMVQALMLRPLSGSRDASHAVEGKRAGWTGDEDGAERMGSKTLKDLKIRIVSESDLPSPRANRQSAPSESSRVPMPMLQPGHTVGIDLGTTYSAISLLDNSGNAQLLPNADGCAITPSVVLLGDDSLVVVGPSNERMSIEDPQRIVAAIKREMGNSDFYKLYQGQRLAPEVISSLILKKLRLDAERQIGPIGNAVITVPYYFDDIRRKATQDAGEIAGLNVIDIINEPTAAALAYAWNRGELGRPNIAASERNILVFDLGGGTFDVTVMTYTSTRLQVKATDGDVMLGGLDWTQRLVGKVAEEFVRKHRIDPRDDPESLAMLTQDCEDAKRNLSSESQVAINAYSRGKSLTIIVTRSEFERLTGDLLQRTRDTTELAMGQAGLRTGQLEEVLLVGGSTLMPVVKTMLRDVTGCEPSQELDPDKAVAQGAAIHAAILGARATGESSSLAGGVIERLSLVGLNNVASHSLGIKIRMNGRKVNHIMIPKNSSIPCDITQRFATTKPNQRQVHVCVLEGDASDPDACIQIGDFHVRYLPPNLPVGSLVEIKYAYRGDGRICVSAFELTSGRESFVEIDRDSGLDQVALDNCRRLIEEFRID